MVAFKTILFPTDFSPNVDKALRHAVRRAHLDDGEVIVQHVVGNYFEKHPQHYFDHRPIDCEELKPFYERFEKSRGSLLMNIPA